MPINATYRLRLQQTLAETVARFAAIDEELQAFIKSLCAFLREGLSNGIFPSHVSKIEGFLAGTSDLAKQLSQEPQVVAVTGPRALVAVNSFIFGKTALLEDEAFFCAKTLFVIGNQPSADANQVSAKIQIYSKGKMSVHVEKLFDSLAAMNRFLATELLVLNCDREFDGLLVEIGVQCQELGRMKIAATPRVDSMIKELLDPNHNQSNPLQHHMCLMVHYFAPYASNDSDAIRKPAEAELNYVCGMAARSALLLLCEHRRDRREEVESCVQRYKNPSDHVCYYTNWQWDGLAAVRPELESLLDAQLKKRSTQLAKKAIKELTLPFKVVHQIKRDIYLSKSVANRQRRQPREFEADFDALQRLATNLGNSFKRMVDSKINDVSDIVAQHLRKGQVRSGIIRAILGRAAELKGSTEHKVEIAFLDVVAKEIREWNSTSQVLNGADEAIHKTKLQMFEELCTKATAIPEIVLVSNDMLNCTEHSPLNSRDSEQRASIHSFVDDMVQKRLRAGKLENFAAGIAAPLWVPLAAITMAIIAPVIGAQKGPQSDEKFQSEIKGAAQDFLDRLDSTLIRTQFFARVRERFYDDAKRLREFAAQYCILPAGSKFRVNAGLTEDSLVQHLVDLEGKLQFLHSNLMMTQVEKLGCEVLSKEDCAKFGVDTDTADLNQLGEQLMQGKSVYLVSPPNSAERPLVLKLAAKKEDSHRLLLEIDILKTIAAERHCNIIQWLGTVYFPNHHAIGFLTYKCDCNLWEFLTRYRSLAVPDEHPLGSQARGAAFVVCRNTCDQIFTGVHLLHSKQILHRDLKPENVLVDVQRPTEPLRIVVKLCDFGLAKHESELSGFTFGGTNGYMAPEIEGHRQPLFSNKSDIYALGVIAWECYFGQRSRERPGALQAVRTGDNEMWDFLVQSMTLHNPTERALIEQCLALLRQFDKKVDASPLDPHRPTLTVPSLKDSLLTLGSICKDGKSYQTGYK